MEGSTTFSPLPRHEARQRSALAGRPALLWVGRLIAGKDPRTVLHGFSTFAAEVPDAHLTFVYAGGNLESDVRREIDTLPGLAGRVTLRGHVPHTQLPAYYSAADLFVSGSRAEGSGYAAVEAMACGAVPVLTDIPPFRGLTADGRFGVLWEPGNPVALTEALTRAWASASDDGLRARVRARFDAEFSWPAIGARARDVYADVVAARASR
jgi:glycosyltransferase involved in cell wall biosynthesis